MATKQIIGHKTDGTTEIRGTFEERPRNASLIELVGAIPDARYDIWQASTTTKHKKYWNALHGQQVFSPSEWDAWGDKFLAEGLFTSQSMLDDFKAAKPVG